LGVSGKTGTQLRLDTGESGVQLSRSRRPSLDLCKRFVEDFGYVKQTDNVAVLVADRLKSARAA
jgi:hypothetical protein